VRKLHTISERNWNSGSDVEKVSPSQFLVESPTKKDVPTSERSQRLWKLKPGQLYIQV